MNEGKSSIHDVLGQLKVERPDCSYVRMNRTREIVRTPIDTRENYQQTQMVNSYSTFTNTNGEQKSEIVKRILRQCPEDDGMVRSFEIFFKCSLVDNNPFPTQMEVHKESTTQEGGEQQSQDTFRFQDNIGRIQDDFERHTSQMDRMFGSIFGSLFSGHSRDREDYTVYPRSHDEEEEFSPRSAPHHVPRGEYESSSGNWTQTSDPESV